MDPVIVMCPCCGSTVDTLPTSTSFECTNCGQVWEMIIDTARLARYALQ